MRASSFDAVTVLEPTYSQPCIFGRLAGLLAKADGIMVPFRARGSNNEAAIELLSADSALAPRP